LDERPELFPVAADIALKHTKGPGIDGLTCEEAVEAFLVQLNPCQRGVELLSHERIPSGPHLQRPIVAQGELSAVPKRLEVSAELFEPVAGQLISEPLLLMQGLQELPVISLALRQSERHAATQHGEGQEPTGDEIQSLAQ
jgi:hypothetical protein